MTMHILFAAGGTGGHINPAIAIAGTVLKYHPEAKISFIGNKKGMEATLVPKAGFDFYGIDVAGFQRKISFENIKRNAAAVYKMFSSTAEAGKLLKKLNPDVVVGTGGYVCGPVLRKAAKLGIKTTTHEQNAFPGVTTKMLGKFVNKIMIAMPEAKERLNVKCPLVITGNPVRQSVISETREHARKALGLDERPMILSFGGSLGARRINESVADVLGWHANSGKYYHYHAIGKYGMDFMPDLIRSKGVDYEKLSNLRITEYINDMDLCMAAADLVVGRSGAITLSEIEVKGKPSILIPSPNVAENHQYYNAKALADKGAAIVIEEKDLTGQGLVKEVKNLIENSDRLEKMGAAAKKAAIYDANERIYHVIMELYKA